MTLLIGFTLQVQSLEELERRAKVCFKKLLPRKQRPPSADTIRLSSTGMELEPIKKLYVGAINKARRGKMMPSIGYYRVVAIDGTGVFSTQSCCCPLPGGAPPKRCGDLRAQGCDLPDGGRQAAAHLRS